MNIVITGASNGIGYETTLHLLKEGHTVFAIARNRKKLDKLAAESKKINPDSKIHLLAGSITDNQFLKKASDEISGLTKSIDILINNAGLLINKPFDQLTPGDWNEVYHTNVFAVVQTIHALLPLLSSDASRGTRSHILNISSMGGFQGSAKFKGLSAYSSSKSALVGITECLAEEFKEKNISVNCLCLGSVQTEMFNKAFPKFTAAVSAAEMGSYVAGFATEGQRFFNGKIIPVSSTTP